MIEDLVKQVRSSGMTIVVQQEVMRDTTHVVSIVDTQGIANRTEAYMLAIALGKHVVSTDCMYQQPFYMHAKADCFNVGLQQSINEKKFVPEESFLVAGDTISGITNAPRLGLGMVTRASDDEECQRFTYSHAY